MSAEYFYSNGFRKLKPFYNLRKTHVKGRWFNRTLLDILSDEFKSNSEFPTSNESKHLKTIENGQYYIDSHLTVDEQKISGARYKTIDTPQDILNYKLKCNDIFYSKSHKHEPSVKQWCEQEITNDKVIAGMEIVHQDENFLVINKPCGIPIHPTSNYYENTLIRVLYNATNGKEFSPCYRLDKITSGLIILGKNSRFASKFQARIRDKVVNKLYLAKVKGRFPGTPTGLSFLTKDTQSEELEKIWNHSEKVVANSPIYVIDPKKSYPKGLSEPREAKTLFQLLHYNSATDESIVLCKPITGRTHQIRIHLLRLNHPIVNDPFYDPKVCLYPKRCDFYYRYQDYNDHLILEEGKHEKFMELMKEFEDKQSIRGKDDSFCKECGQTVYTDPDIQELSLFLHAWKYYTNDGEYSFQCSVPKWVETML
ncbi:hypothetical protein ACO0RG_002193 [Hanseniaspora osmophila]